MPPTRDHTPPKFLPDLDLLASRRNSEPFIYNPSLGDQAGLGRRGSAPHVDPASLLEYNLPDPTIGGMPGMPELPPYPRQDLGYSGGTRQLIHSNSSRRGPSGLQRTNDQFMNVLPMAAQWPGPIPMPTSLDPLEPFFQNPQERNLIHHYCDNSLSIIVAAPSENPNPIVAANLPLVLSQPAGSSSDTEALRSGLMSVAAIHQSYLLARGGSTPDGADAMLRIAQHHRMNSKAHLANACKTAAGTRSDASLAASLAIALTDIFLGGRNWSKNMDLAKTLVRVRGGPSALLGRSYPSTPGAIEGISRNRLFLEILTVYDVAGCIVSGEEVTMLDPGVDNWWLEDAYPNSSWVEPLFGISRPFLPLLAKLVSLLSRAKRERDRAPVMNIDIIEDCHELYSDLEGWTENLSDLSARVHAGNTIYAKGGQMMLLREILKIDPMDPMVQERAHVVLDLCSECAGSKMGVDLIWPVIIAGSHMYGDDRAKVLDVFEAFRTQCCYEIDTAEQVVRQVWKRRDQGHPRPEWRHVMKDFSMRPLLV